MDVRNCRKCGRLYNYIGGATGVCPICAKEEEEVFKKVKEYIRANPKATLNQITEDNEIAITLLKKWIREERLIFTDDSMVGIECEKCGTMIRSGRYCEKCKYEITANLSSAYKKEEPKPEPTKAATTEKDKMRFLNQ